MKKYVALIITLIIAATLTGCWDNTEYENIALVRSIGFDMDKNGDLNVTVEFVKSQSNEKLQKDIEASINKAQRNLNSDVFGIGMKVYQQHRKEWKKTYENEWNQIFHDLPINVKVTAIIQNSGMVVGPPVEK